MDVTKAVEEDYCSTMIPEDGEEGLKYLGLCESRSFAWQPNALLYASLAGVPVADHAGGSEGKQKELEDIVNPITMKSALMWQPKAQLHDMVVERNAMQEEKLQDKMLNASFAGESVADQAAEVDSSSPVDAGPKDLITFLEAAAHK